MEGLLRNTLSVSVALVSVCAIGGFIFSVTSGRETAIRSWEIVRHGLQKSIHTRNWSQAEKTGIECVYLAKGIGAKDFRVALSLGDLGDVLLAQKKPADALETFKLATEIEKQSNSDTKGNAAVFSNANLGYLYCQMGRCSIMLEKPKDAARYFKKSALAFEAVRKAEKKKDLFITQELVRTVIAQAETAGQLQQSNDCLFYYRKALNLAAESFYPAEEVARVRKEYIRLSNLAGVPVEISCVESSWASLMKQAEEARQNGQDREYVRLLQESVRWCEGDKSRQFLALISLRKIAKCYLYNKNYEDARDACNRGLAVWREIGIGGGGDGAADALFGMLLRCITDPRERFAIAQSHLELRLRLYGPDDYHIAETSTKVAVLAYSLGDKVNAQMAMDRAFKVYTQARIKRRGLGLDMIDLGNLFVEMGDYKKAEIIYQRAYKVWCLRPTKYIPFKIDVLRRLHNVYEKLGQNAKMESVDRDRIQLESSLNQQ